MRLIRSATLAVVVLLLTLLRPTVHAATWVVHQGDNLQSIINGAALGDTIVLDANAVFTGNYILPVKSGTAKLTITTDTALPGSTTRVSPASAANFATIRTNNSLPAIATAAGAHDYILLGIKVTTTDGAATHDLITLGDGSNAQDTVAEIPDDFTLDRVYVYGHTTTGVKRCIALNSATTVIKNSYISDAKRAGQDTQAIGGWNGPGPYTIDNNYIEGAGENFLLGGAPAYITNQNPTNVTFTNNYVRKPLSWRTEGWQVKNLLELKAGVNVTITDNVFENNWVDAQVGYAILFTTRGDSPWFTLTNITFSRNILRHTASGINVLATDYLQPSGTLSGLTITQNLVYDMNGAAYGGGQGRFLLINGGSNVTVAHNTIIADGGSTIYGDTNAVTGFVLKDNLFPYNAYGIMGAGTSPGNGTIATFFPSSTISRNVIWGAPAHLFPENNYYPASVADVGFADYNGGNYSLAASSIYDTLATDGTMIGVDHSLLPEDPADEIPTEEPPPSPLVMACPADITATAGASGSLAVTYPAPTLSGGEAPRSASCSPASGSTFSGTSTVTCNGTDSDTPAQTASCTFAVTVSAPAPTISCPANVVVVSPNDQATSVTYSAPTTANGTGTLTTTCTPTSGTSFPIGTSAVQCTTTDTLARSASCGFTVTVQATVVPDDPDEEPVTGPELPYRPSPFTGATRVSIQPTLTWRGTASTYDVYFSQAGSAPTLVATGLRTPYLPLPRLANLTSYSWRVVAKTAAGTTVGTTWTFTTR
jgi:hypothetical protein